MPPATSPTSPARKPRQVVDLELDSVALTENPSNDAAEIFIVRNKGGRVPTESPEEVARAAEVSELKRALAEQGAKLEAQAAELQRRAILEEKAQCVEIARKVAPNLSAKDVDVGDVIYRVRAAARVAKDDTLEAAVNALFRAGSAAFEAAGLNRTRGSTGEESPLPPEIQRALSPYLEKAGGNIARAHTLAVADLSAKAAKSPRDQALNRDYIALRDFNPNQRA